MKVLFISYYFDPFPGVGAKRISYWVNHMSSYGIEPTVLTGTSQLKNKYNIIYLPLSKKKKLISKFIKDEGVNWELSLIEYFENNKAIFNYDIVLLSGGPFMHFGVVKYIKNNFKTKVILDYRDPFGYNPRYKDSFFKKAIKMYFEKKYNKLADQIIVVNEVCKTQISYKEKAVVINNGYDDSVLKLKGLDKELGVIKGLIINGGKIYLDCDETVLIDIVLENKSLSFEQVGQKSNTIDKLNQNRISSFGFMAYSELIDKIKKAEITTVLTGGEAFETPTKVYDYVALNKKILVITEGKLNHGGIQDILKDYPNVIWTKNNKKDMKNAIFKLQKMESIPFDSYKHSRAYGLVKLVKLFKEII